MDTSLTLMPSSVPAATPAPTSDRAITTKVAKIDTTDQSGTLPANKPFVAEVVNARLSGTDFPDNPSEIVPPDRTLRPYNVPMLPYSDDEQSNGNPPQVAAGDQSNDTNQDAE